MTIAEEGNVKFDTRLCERFLSQKPPALFYG